VEVVSLGDWGVAWGIHVFNDCSGGNSRLSHLSGVGGGKFSTHDAVIRVYDAAGSVIESHKHKAEFKEP